MSTQPYSYGLPSSPRATRPGLSPLDTTSFRNNTPTSYNYNYSHSHSTYTDTTPSSSFRKSPASASSSTATTTPTSTLTSSSTDIFANATIPLSPPSSPSAPRFSEKDEPWEGVAPRRRNAFARLLCCLGRRERARRRAAWADEYESVGEKRHWTEA